ncbi:MAG: AEC family transporter [Candidatus Lokiarchaeota archaeon]|nr:AEC family transporter [Candidatus Lokiarchaeota archaeon]MBD3199975.1 AEC family transporter [Candidatus Lokiarchaeota archaeon]
MADVNYTFFLSLTIIALGFILKKSQIISEKNGRAIAKIVFNATLPALIFNTVISIEITPSLSLLSIIPIIYALLVFLFSYLLYRNSDKLVKGLSLMSVIGFNVVHLAFPLIQGIWGSVGLKYIAMFDIANGFVIFVLCYLIGSIFSPKNETEDKRQIFKNSLKKLITSGPLIAYIVGLPLNLLGVIIPTFLVDIMETLGRANSALTLLLLGIFLNFKFKKSKWKHILKILGIRYGFGFTIGLILFFTLPFELLYRGILSIALILPIGLAIIPFSVEFEYDEVLAGMVINLSIIISFGSMWLLILLLGFG